MLRIKKQKSEVSSKEFEKPVDKKLKKVCKEFCVAMGLKHELMKHNYDYRLVHLTDYVKDLMINSFKRMMQSDRDLSSLMNLYEKKDIEFSYSDLYDLYIWLRSALDSFDLSDMAWFYYGDRKNRKGYIESKKAKLLETIYFRCPEHFNEVYNDTCLITGRSKDWGDEDQDWSVYGSR